jgi:hypothetical protein
VLVVWFRRHCAVGSAIGALALALNLWLSFGHVHADESPSGSGSSSFSETHTDDHHGAIDRDHCNVCISFHLLASSFIPTPPTVAVHAFSVPSFDVVSPSAGDRLHQSAFQARGPPTFLV